MYSAIEIVNPIHHRNWDELLTSSRGYSFFHSSEWAEVLHESYGHTPLYFAVSGGLRFSALVPTMEMNSIFLGKRGVSLPFSDYCEPIISEGVPFEDMTDFIVTNAKTRGWKYIEFRCGKNFFEQEKPSKFYFGHVLDLEENAEKMISRFRESTRRNIRKAQREGVRAERFTTLDALTEFYRLHCQTRKYHGLPPQPFHFFKAIHHYVITRDLGFVVLSSHRGVYVAGAVFFHLGEKALFKYGASDRNHQHLRGSNLAMWKAIEWYCRSGYKSLCFGRTEPENAGLVQFKRGWGTRELRIDYFKYDLSKGAFVVDRPVSSSLATRALTNLPAPVLRIIGGLLYRHVG